MFDLDYRALAVPNVTREMFRDTWRGIAAPGTWWTGAERVAIATVARSNRAGETLRDASLPEAANDAVALLGATPAHTTREWVERVVSEIGEPRYIELVGITVRVIAIDTVTGLLGCELEPFPDPRSGEPSHELPGGRLRKGKAWVHMVGVGEPTNTLSAVPAERTATTNLTNFLYMTGPQMGNPDIVQSGLHRSQIELVAATTSYANECFF